jgi:hypothetical protein
MFIYASSFAEFVGGPERSRKRAYSGWRAARGEQFQQRSGALTGIRENTVVQVRSHMKPGVDQSVESGPNSLQEAAALRRQENAERSDDRKPQSLSESSCRPVVKKDPIYGETDRFTFAGSERSPKDLGTDRLRQGLFEDPARQGQGRGRLPGNGGRDQDRSEQLFEQRKLADSV